MIEVNFQIEGLQVVLEQAKVLNSTQVALGFIVRYGEAPSSAQVWFTRQDSISWVKRKYKVSFDCSSRSVLIMPTVMAADSTEIVACFQMTPSPGYILDVIGLEANTPYLMKVVIGKMESNTARVKTLRRPVSRIVEGCLHKNRTYEIGQTFNIGCEQKCVCDRDGIVECQGRCEVSCNFEPPVMEDDLQSLFRSEHDGP